MYDAIRRDDEGLARAFDMQDALTSDYARVSARVKNERLKQDIQTILSDENEMLEGLITSMQMRSGADLVNADIRDIARAREQNRLNQ